MFLAVRLSIASATGQVAREEGWMGGGVKFPSCHVTSVSPDPLLHISISFDNPPSPTRCPGCNHRKKFDWNVRTCAHAPQPSHYHVPPSKLIEDSSTCGATTLIWY